MSPDSHTAAQEAYCRVCGSRANEACPYHTLKSGCPHGIPMVVGEHRVPATSIELRQLACQPFFAHNNDARELVQHAADMIEVAAKRSDIQPSEALVAEYRRGYQDGLDDKAKIAAGSGTQCVERTPKDCPIQSCVAVCSFPDDCAAPSAAPAQGEAESPKRRQYFYKVDACKANAATASDCICWHNEGEGPIPAAEQTAVTLSWREAPVPAQHTELVKRLRGCEGGSFASFGYVADLCKQAADALSTQGEADTFVDAVSAMGFPKEFAHVAEEAERIRRNRAQVPAARTTVAERAHLVALDIAELPDRTSPDDKPDQMLVTEPELVRIIERHFGPHEPNLKEG